MDDDDPWRWHLWSASYRTIYDSRQGVQLSQSSRSSPDEGEGQGATLARIAHCPPPTRSVHDAGRSGDAMKFAIRMLVGAVCAISAVAHADESIGAADASWLERRAHATWSERKICE